MKILKQLLGLCEHKWNIIIKNEIRCDGEKIGDRYHLQCEKCGNMKFKRSS